MTTRLLALALAAAGLSAGGFQLGSYQTSSVPSEPALDRLPADHLLTVALQEPTSRVSEAERVRLRRLAREMEIQRHVAESQRVKALDQQIRRLQRQLEAKQSQSATPQVRLASPAKNAKPKPKPKVDTAQFKDVEVQLRAVRGKLEVVERQRARHNVEHKFNVLTLETLRPEARGRILAEARGLRVEDAERGFALLIALRERDSLKLTPKQVTQLQLLQADFIRRFAPLREEAESGAVIELVGKIAKAGTETEAKFVDVKVGEVVLGGSASTATGTGEVPVLGQLPIIGRLFKTHDASVPLQLRAVVRSSGEDVAKRIEALKNEIDDKAYETLNDDQQKRLRRLVAISLSGPQP